MNRDDRMAASMSEADRPQSESEWLGTKTLGEEATLGFSAGMANKNAESSPYSAKKGDKMRVNIESDKLGNFSDEKSKEVLISALKKQIVNVTFTKLDGKLRNMSCTLQESLLPEITKEGATTEAKKAKTGDVLPVFDTEKQGWRSFRFDSIKSISFEL
tara:strand:- start:506 stop:982 length:477 start_codon:yes stop_codon:yes gene_type:complete